MLLPTVALLLCIPAAQADGVASIHLSFDSPGDAVGRSMSVFLDGDAVGMRGQIDSQGDGDGQVTQQEVDAFEASLGSFLVEGGRNPSNEIVGASFWMENATLTTTVQSVHVSGAAGDVTSTEPVTMEITVVYSWDATPTATHRLLVQADGPGETVPPVDMELEIVAPPGYWIAGSSGIRPGLSADGTVLTATLTLQADHDFSVTFAQTSGKKAPAVGVVAAVLVVGIGFQMRRKSL